MAWADVDAAGLVVVLGRKGRPFRARERRQLTALARIVDHRWTELHTRAGRLAHPSAMYLSGRRQLIADRPPGPGRISPLAAGMKTGSPVDGVDDPHVGDRIGGWSQRGCPFATARPEKRPAGSRRWPAGGSAPPVGNHRRRRSDDARPEARAG